MKPFLQSSLARTPRGAAPIGREKRARPSTSSIPYAAFIAYSSVPAARRALAHLSRLVRTRSNTLTLHPMLWRCDQLEHPLWREMALQDAARASVLVLAFTGTAPLEAPMETWLTQLAIRMHGSELTAFAFTEDDEGWTISLQARTRYSPAPLVQLQTPLELTSTPQRTVAVETEAARAA